VWLGFFMPEATLGGSLLGHLASRGTQVGGGGVDGWQSCPPAGSGAGSLLARKYPVPPVVVGGAKDR